ncbi:DUF4931 domain-containing protein [Aerococcus christensenii]|uniref:DUF4931 domain-containing protein n=1 Tax=Aerococcus christensenii TaxID=87541 RepID=A0A109RCK9_9LACT|nr:DUF4931 domain-containing protein [Aerococcus christensenii]AMB92649.1 galactose-1-phosphate uridylyltransferase [Aerococcus christensenii]PKY91852.1 DUF4931 domain-containing protein [Aerococcus christensenii]
MKKPLIFNHQIALKKPENIRNKEAYCPFCDVAHLKQIFRQEGQKIWLMNKYRTFEDAYQTIIIESSEHWKDISSYNQSENRSIFRFTFDCWLEMLHDDRFHKVLFFKNHGPLSGGSIRHPHFQIVGLQNKENEDEVTIENLKGVEVVSKGSVSVNISTAPIVGANEFNVFIGNLEDLDIFADAVQGIVRYVLKHTFFANSDSYNLFFYAMAGGYYCKVMPRFITSPYFIGFKMSQVLRPEELVKIAEQIKPFLPL